ncbi:hypothetical protein FB466_0906 [Klugiella xanthotipulae]|uniref:Uncharacterized protein n=1 Tax=Klugiella xanthotipulae TaxID=244735 RepID=A0A543I683_9MICO|nr:hypothetical protein FB466_0906 [Klugiella xanthotipulae]
MGKDIKRRNLRIWIISGTSFLLLTGLVFLPIPVTVTTSSSCEVESSSNCDISREIQWIPLYKFFLSD